MRLAPFFAMAIASALASAACSLAPNGLESTDSGTNPTGGHVDASSGPSGPGGANGSGSGGSGGGGGGADAGPGPADAGSPVADASLYVDASDAAPTPTELDVPATDGPNCSSWFDTGVDVAQGDVLTLAATGSWNYGPGSFFACGPAGSSMATGTTLGFPWGELIAATGGGDAFAVGAGVTTAVKTPGRLALGISDDFCGDNAGSLHVSVTVSSP